MHNRSAVLRNRRRTLRFRKRLAVATIAVGAASAALLMREPLMRPAVEHVPVPVAGAEQPAPGTVGRYQAAAQAIQVADARTRRVYPYSIVPGGVHDAAELARIVKTDKLVAQHYAGLQLDKLREVTVVKPRAVYVSYRKGDQVYWTAKKLTLKAGETLLTDGTIEVRTRCGNMISDTPRLPVEAAGPSEEEFDSSVEAGPAGTVAQVSYALGADTNQPGPSYRLVNFGNSFGIVSGEAPARSAFAPSALPNANGFLMPAGGWLVGTATPAPAAPPAATDPVATDPVADAPVTTPAPVETSPAVPTPAPAESTVDAGSPPSSGTPPEGSTLLPLPVSDPVPVPVPEPVLTEDKPEAPAPLPDPAPLPWPPKLPEIIVPGPIDTPQGDVPEPPSPWLAGVAFIAMLVVRRRGG